MKLNIANSKADSKYKVVLVWIPYRISKTIELITNVSAAITRSTTLGPMYSRQMFINSDKQTAT